MQLWQFVLIICGVAVAAALVVLLLTLTRVARRAEGVLRIAEEELRPLVGQAHGLSEELRALIRQANREIERIGAVTDRVNDVAEAVARLAAALSGLGRAGQVVGMVAAVRRGIDVFVERFKQQGDHHE